MSFNFTSIEHAIATVAQKIVTEGKIALSILTKLQSQEANIEGLTQIVADFVPQAAIAVPIERAGFAALGLLLKGAQQVQDAAAAQQNGFSLQVTGDTYASLKALWPQIEAQLAVIGVKIP